jgi:CRISPR-associated protein Csy3
MLGFSASVSPTAFDMYGRAGDAKCLQPVEVVNESVRGTFVNTIAYSKRNAQAHRFNLQRGDAAYLPPECDTLVVKGSIKFLDNTARFAGINEKDLKAGDLSFTEAYQHFRACYIEMEGFTYIAERMVMNLLAGRILWRNADSATAVRVLAITPTRAVAITRERDLDPMKPLTIQGVTAPPKRAAVQQLIKEVSFALEGSAPPLVVEVEAEAVLGKGQVCYPSQEFVEDARAKQGKVLAKRRTGHAENHAYMHAQKIGNPLRRWDLSYAPDATHPIPIEVYGVDMTRQHAYRAKGNSFYDYITRLSAFAGKDDPETHYIMGCFVRGGVFGRSAED